MSTMMGSDPDPLQRRRIGNLFGICQDEIDRGSKVPETPKVQSRRRRAAVGWTRDVDKIKMSTMMGSDPSPVLHKQVALNVFV